MNAVDLKDEYRKEGMENLERAIEKITLRKEKYLKKCWYRF